MKLHVVVEQDEAGYYAAEVPALPGCLSQGKTQEEAIANVKEAIEGWLEVMEAMCVVDARAGTRAHLVRAGGGERLPIRGSRASEAV